MAGLDMNMVKAHTKRKTSLSEALAGVTPIEWSDDVLSGKKKVIVNKAQKEDNACVRLEISYL